MAGVKGRSGRKSNANEEYKLSTIEECWKLVRENVNNPDLPLQFRIELAAKHTVKSIPTELAGGFTASLNAMGTIERVVGEISETIKFNIGSPIDEADPA